MKFYNLQHEFYCGIDLHANSMHVCVVDHAGTVHLHRNFNTKKPEKFLISLQPFVGHDLIIGPRIELIWAVVQFGSDSEETHGDLGTKSVHR